MYGKVTQLYKPVYLFLFKFFSHLGCYIILSRVPCAVYNRSFLVIQFKYSSVYLSLLNSLNYPRSIPTSNHEFVLQVCDSKRFLFLQVIWYFMIQFLNSLYLMLSPCSVSMDLDECSLSYLVNLLCCHTTRSGKGGTFSFWGKQAGTCIRVGAAPRAQREVVRAWPGPQVSPTLGQPIWSIRAKKWEDGLDGEEEPETCRQRPHWEMAPPMRSVWTTQRGEEGSTRDGLGQVSDVSSVTRTAWDGAVRGEMWREVLEPKQRGRVSVWERKWRATGSRPLQGASTE